MGIQRYLGEERFTYFLSLLDNPALRVGQAFYVALSSVDQYRLWQTDADPFNSDDVEDVYAAIDFLLENA